MTVDTVVKTVESEKCGLDMSSYEDLRSSADVGDDGNGHDNDNVSSDCNGDGKDDYVFVNGSDVVSPTNHVENRDNVEIYEAKLSVDGDDNVKVSDDGEGESDRLTNEVKIDEEESKVEDEVNVGEENKEIELRSEGAVDSKVDGEVGVGVGVSEINEGSVHESVVDEVKGDESVFESADNGDASVDSIGSRSFDDDNGKSSVCDGREVAEVEVEDSVHGNGVPDVPEPSDVVAEINNAVESIDSRSLDVDDNSRSGVCDGQVVAEVEVEDTVNGNGVADVPAPSKVEAGNNNAVESIDSRSLDVDDNRKSSVYDAQEVTEVEVEDSVDGNGISDVPELSKVVAGNNNAVDSIDSRSLDVDDNSKIGVCDGQEGAEVEVEDSVDGNGVPDVPEPSEVEAGIDNAVVEVTEGEINEERHVALPSENGIEIQRSELDRNVTENSDGTFHSVDVPLAESASGDIMVVEQESEPIETDVTDRSVENGLAETQSLDGDIKASLSLNAEDEGLPLDDATPAEHSSDFHQQNLVLVNGENEKRDIIEADAKIEQPDDQESLAGEESRESMVSETAVCEVDQGVIIDHNGSKSTAVTEETTDSESLLNQSEGAENEGNQEIVAPGMENQVSIITRQPDESEIVSTDSVEENGRAITTDMQCNTTDKPDVEDQSERVDGEDDGEPEVTGETGGSQESSPEEGVSHDLVAEQIVSFDVVDKKSSSEDRSPEENLKSELQSAEQTASFDVVHEKISSEVCSSEKNLTSEDTTNFPELQSAVNTVMDADQNDDGDSHSKDDVSENIVVPASDESSEDVGSDLRSEDKHTRLDSVEEVPALSSSDDSQERKVVSNVSSAATDFLRGSTDDTSCQTKLENNSDSIPCPVDDNKLETETVEGEIDVAIESNNISEETPKPNISFGSFGGDDVLNKTTFESTANGEALLKSPVNGDHSDGFINDTVSAKVAQSEQIDNVSATSAEGSEIESSDVQNINPDMVRRPFCWLVKVPRFDEGKYKDQLRQGEIELAEKTKTRDAFQAEVNRQQAYCRELKSSRDAANSEVKAARELVWAKTREIDSAHSLINLARHAITVEDIDNKIHSLEHTLQHQTLNNLKEEKELVREIKQLNLQRQKLSANPQRQQEVQEALNQRGQTEEQLKVLKKELDGLRDNLSKADEHFRAAKKKHEDEITVLNDLKQQLKSADDIRQAAYAHLKTIQKQLNEKNAPFYKAKNDLRVAYNYATAGKKDSLERHCINQVEKVMEMWNKNDEFRKEYIQCNMRRTVWKFGTLDGTRLGINEVPPSFGNVSDNRVKTPAKVESATTSLTMVRDLPVDTKTKTTEDKSSKKVEQKKAPPVKTVEAISKINVAKAPVIIEIEEVIEEPKLTKEEEESARKAEQLRKEEEAVRLREQRKLEEKAKAEEALERKRRNALKAQARAEFKARKEAEEKEKEREKRAKKKGKKKGIISEVAENEPAQPLEISPKAVKEPEIAEKPTRTVKKPQKVSLLSKQIKTTKPIPPALRSKGKRGLLRYWPYACIVLLAIALFYLGSYERIQTIKQFISALLH
ncbi:hypothetical protein vseg_006475 [Gypsophila vaccaria]